MLEDFAPLIFCVVIIIGAAIGFYFNYKGGS